MAIDKHGAYSRSERRGGRVVRLYLGKGPAAELAALLDRQRREGRAARRAERDRLARADRALRELGELAGLMLRATMAATGYHRHDRGAWRRRRAAIGLATDAARGTPAAGGGASCGIASGGSAGVDTTAVAGEPGRDDPPRCEARMRELLALAERGDLAVLPGLRRMLAPGSALWQRCGEAAGAAEATWIDLVAGGDPHVLASLGREIAAGKAGLAGPDAPPIERLLAERASICRLQAAHAGAALARAGDGGLTPAQIASQGRRLGRAHRAYRASIASLGTVRRMAGHADDDEAAGGSCSDRREPTGAGGVQKGDAKPACIRRVA